MPRRRILVLTGTGVAVLLLIIEALQSVNWFQPRITQDEVRHQIETGLPLGSTIGQTIAFLGGRGWVDPHTRAYPNLGASSSDGFEQKDPQFSL